MTQFYQGLSRRRILTVTDKQIGHARGVSHCGPTIYIKRKKNLKREGRIIKSQMCHNAKIYFSNNPHKETKILPTIITLPLISSSNTSQNLIFQKSSYRNRPGITYGPEWRMLYTNQNTISMATNAWPINYLLRVRPYH
jgi:hypothetical protein